MSWDLIWSPINSTIFFSIQYICCFYIACCASMPFWVSEMSTSLLLTQQPSWSKHLFAEKFAASWSLGGIRYVKGNVTLLAQGLTWDYLQLQISGGFYTLEACGPPWISTKRQKCGMTLPVVRKAESFPILSYKLKTHSFKKCLKSPSLRRITFSLHVFHLSSL